MATNDQYANRASRSLNVHKDPEKLVGHNEQARLEAYNEGLEEPVPAVPADISETPKFIKYGAAVLLGLAFGIGTYVWYNKGVPSAADNTQTLYSAGTTDYNYFGRPTFYDIFYSDTDIPAPFGTMAYTQGSDAVAAQTVDISDAASANGNIAAIPVVVYLFQYDSSSIPETKALTDIAGKAAKAGISLDIKAYTDAHGRVAYNRQLSERRANAIADYLIAHGMPASKVKIYPMEPTKAFGSDAADRRAEITPTH